MPPVGSQHCPHCQALLEPADPLPFGVATCPACARQLWYLTLHASRVYFRHSDPELVRQLLDATPEHQLMPEHLELDSIDIIELLAEFQAALSEA